MRGAKYYACSRCRLIYPDKQLAAKCEESCSKGTCDLEVVKHAVGRIYEPGIGISI